MKKMGILIILFLLVTATIQAWGDVGKIRISIISPRPDQELLQDRRDVVLVPIELNSNCDVNGVKINFNGKNVWSQTLSRNENGQMIISTAEILDPSLLSELEKSGQAQLYLTVSGFKQSELLPIAGTGLSKEAGRNSGTSDPVIIRIIRLGHFGVSVKGSVLGISTKSRKLNVFSGLQETNFGLRYETLTELDVPASGELKDITKPGGNFAIVDGVGNNFIYEGAKITSRRVALPTPVTSEKIGVTLEKDGDPSYGFDFGELLISILLCVATSGILAMVSKIRKLSQHVRYTPHV